MPLRRVTASIGFACCLLAGCGKSPEPQGVPAAATPEYVGSERCGECHRPTFEAWLGSHHQRAMLPATEASVAADFGGTSFGLGGVSSSFSRPGGGFAVRTGGPEGGMDEFDVRFTFGVEPLQQYLLELPGGRLQAFGIAWDTVGRRWFHLQPEDGVDHNDPLHWTGRHYNWNFMCADCHSTGVRKGYAPETDTYNTEFAEVSVGCEACHGPGSLHVDRAMQVSTPSARSPNADPRNTPLVASTLLPNKSSKINGSEIFSTRGSHGEPVDDGGPQPVPYAGLVGLGTQAGQVNSCAPCHSRRTQLADGFTPDRPFLDYYLPSLLEPGLYESDGQILDEVYVHGSFLQSRMFARGVTCGDCHEPHSAQLVAQRDALCTRCHNEAGHPDFPTLRLADYDTPDHHLHSSGSEASRCVSCHMPERTYMALDGRRDHGLRIPRPDLTVTLGIRNACSGCHDDRAAGWARDVLARQFGSPEDSHFAPVLAAARGGRRSAAAELAQVAENPDQAAIVRATAFALMESYDDAGTALALETGLRDPHALVRIGALRGAARFAPERFWRRARHLLDDDYLAVRTEAARLLAGTISTLRDEHSGKSRLLEVLDEYLATQRFNADRPEAHTNMASAFAATGELERAEEALRAALNLSADWVPALVNLADLYRATNRDRAGGELLERASALAGDSAEVKLARALWLVRQGRHPEALPLLAAAVELAPDNAHYAYVYAVALHSRGESTQALAVIDQVLERRPGDRNLLRAAAGIARDTGDDAKMQQYVERL